MSRYQIWDCESNRIFLDMNIFTLTCMELWKCKEKTWPSQCVAHPSVYVLVLDKKMVQKIFDIDEMAKQWSKSWAHIAMLKCWCLNMLWIRESTGCSTPILKKGSCWVCYWIWYSQPKGACHGVKLWSLYAMWQSQLLFKIWIFKNSWTTSYNS